MGSIYNVRRKAGHTPDDIYNSSSEAARRVFRQEYDADKAVERSNAEYGAQRVASATLNNERALARDNAEAMQQADAAASKAEVKTGAGGDTSTTRKRARFNAGGQIMTSLSI